MTSVAPSRIDAKRDRFSIKIRLENELGSLKLDLRQRRSFPIYIQLEHELCSLKPDLNQI